MVREIVTYPDKVLREKSKDVVEFDDKLHTLLDDMYETMIKDNGVGLAGIQIAVPLNILLINIPNEEDIQDKADLIEAINPVFINKKGEQNFTEGCLSVPGYYAEVKRAEKITVEYFDRFGKKHTMKSEGFLAVAWQHEMEHLSGHLFIENLSITKRKKFEKDYRKKLKTKKK